MKLESNKNKALVIIIGIMLLAGFGIRLYDLTDPPLDFHPTRQLRSAILARGIYYEGLPDSPERATALQTARSLEVYEPPILEAIVAGVYRVTGGEVLWVSRVLSSLFWIIAAAALSVLLKRWQLEAGSIISAGIFLFLPFAVQASRSFQPDPFMVMWISLFVLCVDIWLEKRTWKWAILAGLTGGIAVLVKVVAAFFVGGVLLLSVVFAEPLKQLIRNRKAWLIALLAVIPPAVYYLLIIGSRSAGFFSAWTLSFMQLLVDTKFYSSWLAMIDSLVSLPWFFTALIGTMTLASGSRKMMLGLWIGYFIYGITSPYQFITHTYYHLPLILLVTLGLASVANMVLEKLRASGKIWQTGTILILLFAAGYSLWVARSILYTDNYQAEVKVWSEIGKAVPDDGPVIALTQDYGNRLMYYGWTKVGAYWPATSSFNRSEAAGKKKRDIEELFVKNIDGKKYFLVTALGQLQAQPELQELLSQYTITASGDGYILYDLTQPLSTE